MDRWIRFAARGAHLVWRVKNGAKSVPFKTIKTLPDGSELVLLRESDSMLGKRRRDAGDKTLARLPDTVARLVSFTVTTRTARRVKTSVIKVLTTLLGHGEFPAPQIAALYAERWQVEIAYLHLKKTVKGTGRVLRGRSVTLARQEAWALLLVHNMTATLRPRRRAGRPGPAPDPVHRRAIANPRTRHRRCLLPALQQAARQRKQPRRPAHRPGPRTASPPGPARADLGPDGLPAAELAHRRSHIHDNNRPVESPASGHTSQKLRAVPPGETAPVAGR